MEVSFTIRIGEAALEAMRAAMQALSTAITRSLADTARQLQEQARPRSGVLSAPAAAGCPCLLCQSERTAAGLPEPVPPSGEQAKVSLWQVLERPEEALAVQSALRAGQFDGRFGDRCLIGIVARCRDMVYGQLATQLSQRLGQGQTPIESWVVAYVHHDMTPENSERAALLDAWLTEWLEEHKVELPAARERLSTSVMNAWDATGDYSLARQRSVEEISAALGLPAELLHDERPGLIYFDAEAAVRRRRWRLRE